FELARHVQVYEAREIIEDASGAVARAGQVLLVAVEVQRIDGHPLRRSGCADDDTRSAWGKRVPRLLHGRDTAHGDHRVLGAASVGQSSDALDHVVARSIDRVCSAERTRKLELVICNVDRDERVGAAQSPALNGVQPNTPGPEDCQAGTSLDSRGVYNGTRPGGDGTADQGCFI